MKVEKMKVEKMKVKKMKVEKMKVKVKLHDDKRKYVNIHYSVNIQDLISKNLY